MKQYKVEGYESAGNRTVKSKWYKRKSDAMKFAKKINTMWRVFVWETKALEGLPSSLIIIESIKND